DYRPSQLTQSPRTMRLVKLSKACFGPRHCRLSTFCSHDQHRRRTPLVLRIAAVPRRSSYSTSAAIATNPVRRHAAMAAVHNWLTNTAPTVRRLCHKNRKPVGRARRRPLSEQAPGDIGENKEANDDQGAPDGAPQRTPRHGVGKYAAEPGAAAQACREDDPQDQVELAVDYIPGGGSNRHWKLKNLAQSDTGEHAEPHGKKNRHQQQRSARPRQRREKSCSGSGKEEYAVG